MVDPFCFAFICFKVHGSRFMVQGSGLRWRLRRFFYWAMPQSAFLVTSHSYDTREGIVSHVWRQILRLSPHLFWLGLFIHRAFSSAQDDGYGKSGWALIWVIRCVFWELAVLYYDTSRPLETESRRGTSEFGLIQRGA